MKFEEASKRAAEARREGCEVVLVLGLGFVGTAVVANLSRTKKGGKRAFFVIGLDRDDPAGREKADSLDQGRSPTYALRSTPGSGLRSDFFRLNSMPNRGFSMRVRPSVRAQDHIDDSAAISRLARVFALASDTYLASSAFPMSA